MRAETAPVARGKVLVVEDDDGMREAITSLLDAAGIESAAYASAEALLACGGAAAARCVVSDLVLPAMSGLDLLDALSARGAPPRFILITAHDSRGVRDEAARRGAAACLAKPFAGDALLAAIADVVNPGSTK
jgi:two-component system, LuxR family, response regulator FixJ